MNTPECDHLDGYLADSLSVDAAARFEAHLAGCPLCRRDLQHQGEIDRLLAEGTRRLEPIPAGLVDRIEGLIRAWRRRRVARSALGLSAAVAVALAAAIWLPRQRGGVLPRPNATTNQPPEAPAVAQHEAVPRAHSARGERPRARVRLTDASDGILVPIEASNPNVSIVWIYPVVKPAVAASRPATGSP